MQTRAISREEAISICTREESHFFDRKAAAIKGAKLQKIAVALANAEGGEFCVGVADDKEQPDAERRWNGAENIEDFNQHIQALMDVQPPLPLDISFLKSPLSDNYVLLVQVEKSQHVHQTSDKTVYVRKGAQSLPLADAAQVTALSHAKGASSFEDFSVDDALAEDIVDASPIREFLRQYSSSTDPLDLCLNKGLLDKRSFKPKVAGLLLFSETPTGVVPRKCSVRIARYETKEDDPDRDHLAFVESVEGPLYELIHRTVDRVTEVMSGINVWTTDGAKSMEYPPETLWEVVVNALIHRDYSVSDDVQILIFDNRIEVISPGRLPAFVTTENILDARYARNAKIVSILSKYKNPPNKDIGEGLNTAFQKMKEWRLRKPEISEDGNSVKVVLPHAALATPQEAIMEFVNNNGSINNRQARDITGIKSENAVKAEFYKLRDAGILEMNPTLKGNKAEWRKRI